MRELSLPVLWLISGPAGFCLALLVSAGETAAAREWRRWPFRCGFVVIRFRDPIPLPPLRSEAARLSVGAEYRVVTPDECLFVRPGWKSHLAWSLWSSPYILKGRAVSRPASVTVTGRLSVAASIGIPAVIAWLVAGGALMSDPSSTNVNQSLRR